MNVKDRMVTLAVARRKHGQNRSWAARAATLAEASRYSERASFWERMARWIETGEGA